MHTQILQRLYRLGDARQNWHAYIFDKDILCCRCAALHAIEDNYISASFYRKCRVLIWS